MVNSTLDRQQEIDPLFLKLALGSAIVTFLMIVIGAITRVSESGMGCGTDWPNCNGRIVPEFTNAATAIEFGHRLFALLVGLFTVALLVRAWQHHRREPRLFVPAVLGLVLYFVQSGLGAVTVKLNNQWLSVLLHLGNSMLLLAVFIVAWLNARPQNITQQSSIQLTEAVAAAILALAVAMVGAAVAGNNATKACVSYPLCYGEIWPVDQGPLQTLNMAHRLIAGSLGVFILVMLFQARNANATLRNALFAALGLYLLQAAIGAAVVLVNSPTWLIVAQSLHVTFAAATWSAMIILCGEVWLQQQSNKVRMSQREPLGAPSVTTSS
jgi:heme A synthase